MAWQLPRSLPFSLLLFLVFVFRASAPCRLWSHAEPSAITLLRWLETVTCPWCCWQSVLTTSWTLEPGLSSHSQGRGWPQGARHRDIHRKDLQLFGSEEESTACKQLEILQPDQCVWSCKEVWLSSVCSASFLTSQHSLFIPTLEEGPWLLPDLQSLA